MVPTGPHDELRREVEAAVLEALRECAATGKALNRSAIHRQFQGRAARSTIFDWIARFIEETSAREKRVDPAYRRAGVVVINGDKAVEDQATAPPPRAEEPAASVVVEPEPSRALSPMAQAWPILDHLRQVIEDVLRVRGIAFHADGRVKNSRMVLKAAEEMRKSLETIVKLQAAMNDVAALERFHAAIIDVIRQEEPALAERVLRKMDDLAARWGG